MSRIVLEGVAGSLLVCAAVLAVHLPTPGDYWIRYDNEVRIRAVPRIKALTLEGPARTEALVKMFTEANEDQYQPLHSLSLAIDHALFGWNKAGFHAHAIALQAATMVALFALALRLVGVWSAALLSALFVAVHPTMVEAVTWTIHRNLLLANLWTLLATYAYLGYARDPSRWGRLVVSMLAYGVSLVCKVNPAVVLVPFVVDLWVFRPASPRVVLEKLPLAVAALALSLVNLSITQGEAPIARPWLDVAAGIPGALTLNAANSVLPDGIALFYPAGQSWSLVGLRWIAVCLAGGGLLAWGVHLWRRGERGLLLALGLWIPLVLPGIAATTYREYATADRYANLALAFVGLGLAAGLARVFADHTRWRGLAQLAVAALLVPLAWSGRAEARRWADEAVLWQVVLDQTPHPTAHGALANVLKERDRWFEAVAELERAVALLEEHPDLGRQQLFYFNLTEFGLKAAEVARESGLPDGEARSREYLEISVRAARDGLARWPEFTELRYDLGWAYLELGRSQEAADAFEATIQRSPRHFRARARLGIARKHLGQIDAATRDLVTSLRLHSRYRPALTALAEIYEEQERFTQAAGLRLRLVVLDPEDREAHRRFLDVVATGAEQEDAAGASVLLQRYVERYPEEGDAQALLERLRS